MHIYSHAASIYPLYSFLLNLHSLIHTHLYTNQVLHQPAYTQTVFYTKHFLQKPTLQPTSFYTNPLFHKLVFPQTTFYTNQLLYKRVFAHSSFYANQLFDQLYTDHVLHQPTSFTQSLPCAECRRLLNMGSFIKHNKQTASSFSKKWIWKTTQLILPTCQVEGC